MCCGRLPQSPLFCYFFLAVLNLLRIDLMILSWIFCCCYVGKTDSEWDSIWNGAIHDRKYIHNLSHIDFLVLSFLQRCVKLHFWWNSIGLTVTAKLNKTITQWPIRWLNVPSSRFHYWGMGFYIQEGKNQKLHKYHMHSRN